MDLIKRKLFIADEVPSVAISKVIRERSPVIRYLELSDI
jgi:hypothetical protein